MNQRTHSLLSEAVRRFLCFNTENRPLTEAWTGLGTASEYAPLLKDGLMAWVHGAPQPRCQGWLKLTDKGARTVRAMLRAHLCGDSGYDMPTLPAVGA